MAGLLVATFLGAIAIGMVVFDHRTADLREPAAAPVSYEVHRDSDVPNLPFADNPDPSQCGIPIAWGDSNNKAWLTGVWHGELIEHDVLLYDSHLRQSVVGSAPHGSQVEILLFQENPVLDYYYVRVGSKEGWVPEPFVSFDPVT